MLESEAPQMKVNWVRVYQDPNDPVQKVGCSTPERPTRKYIEAHAKLYKQESDVSSKQHEGNISAAADWLTRRIASQLTPLKGIQIGRGSCNLAARGEIAAACGGVTRGYCTKGGVCECLPDWTGPNCMAHRGSDPIIWDAPDSIEDVGFEPPFVEAFKFLIAAFALLGGCLFMNVRWRKALEGWEPIPDVSKTPA